MANLSVLSAALENLGEGVCPSRPCPSIINSVCAFLVPAWPLGLVPGEQYQPGFRGTQGWVTTAPSAETSSLRDQHPTRAATSRLFYLAGPPATATNSAWGMKHQPDCRLATCPWPKGKRRDFRLDGATSGSDVGVSTCKMAAHHRQNTAGRRKVQVWEPGSATSRTWLPAQAHLQRADAPGRAAISQGSGLGRVGRGAAGGEGWGRGANGFRRGRGAAD